MKNKKYTENGSKEATTMGQVIAPADFMRGCWYRFTITTTTKRVFECPPRNSLDIEFWGSKYWDQCACVINGQRMTLHQGEMKKEYDVIEDLAIEVEKGRLHGNFRYK
jgi:hypothetical protein